MTDNEMLLRLLSENFSLKDQLAEAQTETKRAKEDGDFWYKKYREAQGKPIAEDVPLSMEGLKNKCDMTTA